MDSPLHARDEATGQTVDGSRWKCSKEDEMCYVCMKINGHCFFKCSLCSAHRQSGKTQNK